MGDSGCTGDSGFLSECVSELCESESESEDGVVYHLKVDLLSSDQT